jgi:phosphatidylserine/phosphatidylglycerophosphate/cardiolipin synthase-like enzyme
LSHPLKSQVVEALRRASGPVTSKELLRQLNCDEYELAKVLLKLSSEGVVERVYTKEYDSLRPFYTLSWRLTAPPARADREREAGGFQPKIQLVASVPVVLNREDFLNKYGLVDFSDAYISLIETAERELKIACPYIDEFGASSLITKMRKKTSLTVRVLTELTKSPVLSYYLRLFADRLLVKDFSKVLPSNGEGKAMKLLGLHTKLLIADDSAALLGSFNLSKYHWLVDFDLGVLVHDSTVVLKLSALFEELWGLAGRI